MFEAGDKVILNIGKAKFKRTVLEVFNGAVYLAEGGDAFHNETGKVWGNVKKHKFITAA